MITAIASSITATLNATEITAIRSITPGLFSGVRCAVRRAMKKGEIHGCLICWKIYAK